MTVYFFSGLGADERVFQKLKLPEDWKVVYMKWPEVQRKETLNSYCDRLSSQINKTEDYSFIGLSFGGMIAVELAKLFSPKHVIIISSISNNKELPFYLKAVKLFRIHKIIPGWFLAKVSFLTYWFFGVKSKEERILLKNVIERTPPRFIKWAIGQILSLKNDQRPPNILHIHGSNDRLLCFRNVQADVKIEGGGHFIVYNKADEITPYLIRGINNPKN